MLKLVGIPVDMNDLLVFATENLQKYDSNGDSEWTLDESLKMLEDVVSLLKMTTTYKIELNRNTVEIIFFAIDENNNGKMSKDEIGKFVANLKKGNIGAGIKNFALNELVKIEKLIGLPRNLNELLALEQVHFQKYDENEDKQLSVTEATKMLRDFASYVTKTTPIQFAFEEKEMDTIFVVLDENNDNQISQDEIRKLTINAVNHNVTEILKNVILNNLFRHVDTDFDGFITKAEIANAIKSCSKINGVAMKFKPMVRMMAIDLVFGTIDENHDNRITRTEILNASIFKQ